MVTNNSINSNIPIEISKGGTNATSMATSTGIVKYDGTSLVTSSTALIDASNRMTNTSQPAFSAYVTDTISNVTGDATDYTVVFGTEIFDQAGNFDGTSTFTAPVTGKYLLTARILLGGILNTHNVSQLTIVTSNRTYESWKHPYNCADANPYLTFEMTCFADMDAADTAKVKILISGGTKVVDVLGGGSAYSIFSGYLVC